MDHRSEPVPVRVVLPEGRRLVAPVVVVQPIQRRGPGTQALVHVVPDFAVDLALAMAARRHVGAVVRELPVVHAGAEAGVHRGRNHGLVEERQEDVREVGCRNRHRAGVGGGDRQRVEHAAVAVVVQPDHRGSGGNRGGNGQQDGIPAGHHPAIVDADQRADRRDPRPERRARDRPLRDRERHVRGVRPGGNRDRQPVERVAALRDLDRAATGSDRLARQRGAGGKGQASRDRGRCRLGRRHVALLEDRGHERAGITDAVHQRRDGQRRRRRPGGRGSGGT